MPTVIDQAVQTRLIASVPSAMSVSATLHYHRKDPLAVRISFPAEVSLDGSEVEWTFARELLAAGLHGPAGDGDVQVWPCGLDSTVLEFHTDEGLAMVQVGTEDLRRFLRKAYAAVPADSERRVIRAAMDRDIAALLRDA
ncbi:SsgA family sporulation/cell division regulator [Streptomyces sp. H27-D2]|uniref:SsgA family sporulation/cell division regulator n=1 Tax=Streptomyces sp. H27-D2 TaxID=3046304 RepID=UPI002DBDE4AE|nr:SsgA family sporulation/cell division regulator [Streptomyces sp. H27-D2]MEC4017505.1 SsgA family sporulation/cell division regulator [Streptomyces sp. H27-D2]